jgi:hypothetical protein
VLRARAFRARWQNFPGQTVLRQFHAILD